MAWQELSIAVPHEFVEPISYLFSRYGRGLSMEPDGPDRIMLRTYLLDSSKQRLARIDVGVRLVSSLSDIGELAIKEVSDQDWQNAWKAHFTLLKIGERLVIKPTWIDYEPQPEAAGSETKKPEIIIELDPGLAFGTGYHPTTYTCLETVEQHVSDGSTVLDLGTGSGILSIAAVRLGASRVVAVDTDPQAIKAARQNFRRTRTNKVITLIQGSLPHAMVGQNQFDLALANISARAVCDRAQFIVSCLKNTGILVASGMMRDQSQQVLDTLSEMGCTVLQEWSRDEWVTIAFRPPQR